MIDDRGCEFEYWQKQSGLFSSPELNFLCCILFGVCCTPVILQHLKDPGHFAKNAGGRLPLKTHDTPLTQ